MFNVNGVKVKVLCKTSTNVRLCCRIILVTVLLKSTIYSKTITAKVTNIMYSSCYFMSYIFISGCIMI